MQQNIIYDSATLPGDPSGTMPFHAREIPGALSSAEDCLKHMPFMKEKSPDL
ncbi:MAG: hypothetical protein LBL07_19315 [Tannerella sp.]|jgi:hypothetical protein|nr:hypothetical protein [Tannerella sp.]